MTDYRKLLESWKTFSDELDVEILDLNFRSDLYTQFRNTLKAAIVDDDRWGWLEWWAEENDFGRGGLTGEIGFGDDYEEKMAIRSQEDLIAALERLDKEHR